MPQSQAQSISVNGLDDFCKQEVRGSNPRRSTASGRGIPAMGFRVFRAVLGGEYQTEYHLGIFRSRLPQSALVSSRYSSLRASRI